MRYIYIILFLLVSASIYSQGQVIDLGAGASVKKGFPSLYGQGADSISGGRGQPKFFVTSTLTSSSSTFVPASSGVEAHYTGTFLGAFEQGNVNIIPYVSENIDGSNIVTNGKDNITFHGQLAPEGGIAITNGRMELQNAENVIIRYLTVRNNDLTTASINDAVNLNRPQKVALDHMSAAWEGDEALSIFPGSNSVLYENIIIQRFQVGQTDQDNGGSKGALLGSGAVNATTGDPTGETRVNMHLSSFLSSSHRTPSFGGHDDRSEGRFYNNVIYTWLGRTTVTDGVGEKIDLAYCYYKHNNNSSYYSTDYPLSFQMMNMPIAAFNESTDTASIFTEGNFVVNLLTDLEADNRVLWTRWEHTNPTNLEAKNFRTTRLPIQAEVGYVPITALQAKVSVVDNKEVGNNRATDENGNIVFYHDSVDEAQFTAFNTNTAARVVPSTWVHPSRPLNTAHQTDTDWNGIYDGFETENGLGVSTESESSYSWKGDTYLNPLGYDNFEVWSFIQGGAKELLNGVSNVLTPGTRTIGSKAKTAGLKSL